MPNWCEGSLKVRGKYENVKRFFCEGLNVYEGSYDNYAPIDKSSWLKVYEYPDATCIDFSGRNFVYVEGTRRAFVDATECDVYVPKSEGKVVAFSGVKQAWCFEVDDWLKIARKYDVDIKLFGIERGCQYEVEIEIVDGEVVKHDEWKYDDFDWDCPFPWIGG